MSECPIAVDAARLQKENEDLKARLNVPSVKSWTQTVSGVAIDLDNPDPETILISDIAKHLSQINRYAGGTRFPYSVAQHSVLCASVAPPGLELACLMHDAHEAYLGDIPSPIKILLGAAIRKVEDRLEKAVAWKWRLSFPHSKEVREVDVRMLWTEHLALQAKEPRPWFCQDAKPFDVEIERWTAELAEARFLEEYARLGGPGRAQ